MTFEQCHAGRTYFDDGGLRIPFIGLEQLLLNKAASPRGRDKIDLEELLKLKRAAIDRGDAASK